MGNIFMQVFFSSIAFSVIVSFEGFVYCLCIGVVCCLDAARGLKMDSSECVFVALQKQFITCCCLLDLDACLIHIEM